MGYHVKFKDKTSQKWFKSKSFDSKEEMHQHYWNKIRGVATDVTFHHPEKEVKTEETDMKNLVEQIVSDNIIDAERVFEEAMIARKSDLTESIRPATYASLFGAETPLSEEEVAAIRSKVKVEEETAEVEAE